MYYLVICRLTPSIDILIDTCLTLHQQLINSQSIAGQVLTDSYESIENWLTVNCNINSVNQGVGEVSIEAIA